MPLTTRRKFWIGGAAIAAAAALETQHLLHRPRHHLETDGKTRSLRIAWPDSDTDPLLMLAQDGEFGQFGLDVTIINAANGDAAIDAVTQGRADAAVAPLLAWIPRLRDAPSGQLPARLLCGLRGGSYRLLVNRHLPIHRVSDLAGRNIGVYRLDGADRRFLGIRLRRRSMNPDQGVNWVQIPPNELDDAFLAGRVDALVVHDPLGWRIMRETKGQSWDMLDSMTGAERERVDQCLGIASTRLEADPGLAPALILALRAAAHNWPQQKNEIARQLAEMPDPIPDPRAMLDREIAPHIVLGHDLMVQVAEYTDELKLIGQIPNERRSMALAHELCVPPPEPTPDAG
ncbi:nitrate/sulfonate/bicarbonate transporter substrate-binding periplasmic protein [Neoasaia chiangmaiensis NBRC 101099]|uniref:Uncharacterized protein n=1 Tax=Neoasaia chiangmaiensis TaxID=320497 RepID=A0A1U9KQZ9_9PROT|nr:ABC transporter substrate-binding protein [Neoasaia chiangmaiensis]AQS88233.1 hypothetical protein A0U93_10090 [Neoasaia chiangmaiensis]GBR39784.1 nitrate/sulfonate/bicarbonate transporter substrate-binding periplasmic protein [Neoasaia chiangmaiensis NBRC 101099]GEN14739.1 hypothetical protein NCH01_11700 [Neoasaia chiangmaiensis]